jgi:hypothetical protein
MLCLGALVIFPFHAFGEVAGSVLAVAATVGFFGFGLVAILLMLFPRKKGKN